jgi:hypothetical protein
MSGAIVWDGASLGVAEAGAALGDGDPVPSFGLTRDGRDEKTANGRHA